MKKTIFFIVILLISVTPLFAKQTTEDVAISEASKDIKYVYQNIKSVYRRNPNLVIYDFETPTGNHGNNMSDYIRDKLANYLQESGIIPIARDPKDFAMRDKELYLEHKSGKFNKETIHNVAGLWGADLIVYGEVKEWNKAYELTLYIQDINSGQKFTYYHDFSRSSKTEQQLRRAAVYPKVALGFGTEVNNNSYDALAPAGYVSLDYNVFRGISLGVKIFASYDMNENSSNFVFFETLALLRVYLVSPSGEPGTGVFIEGLGGVSIYPPSEYSIGKNAGGGFGYRAAFGNFYIEPAIRIGYPYIFGAGLSAGFRF